MKNNIFNFAILVITLACTQAVFADLKIKSKQTMSGQSYENTTFIKGKRSRAETMNGAMINITQCDLRRGIQVNPNARTYMVNPFADVVQTKTTPVVAGRTTGAAEKGGKITTTITIKDTGERKQMFGFTARHLIITMEMVSSPDACFKNNTKMTTDGWYIDFESGFDCGQTYASYDGNQNKSAGCQDKYEMKTIGTAKRGYPIYEKMTMFDESGKETFSILNEVVELSKATLDAGLFDVPEGYREVSDAASMYSSASSTTQPSRGSYVAPSNSGLANSVKNAAQSSAGDTQPFGAKKKGTIRIGLAGVKTRAVGEGLNAYELSAAIQSSLIKQLKASNLEVVALEAKVASAIDSEARSRECDYVIHATVSHKKGGGGGFGMFSKVIAPAIGNVGFGHTGSTAGNIAASVAVQAIVTAGSLSGVKSKDEITLDVKLNKTGGESAFAKIYKVKAKSDGEDIVTVMIGQATQAIAETVAK